MRGPVHKPNVVGTITGAALHALQPANKVLSCQEQGVAVSAETTHGQVLRRVGCNWGQGVDL